MGDVIITGIPRSGTSLAAALLDQAPNAFCLSEPREHFALVETAADAVAFTDHLCLDFDRLRETLLSGGEVMDRRDADGSAVTNYFTGSPSDVDRKSTYSIRAVARKGLRPDFILGIKHNAPFTAVLPEIARRDRFRIITIIRDPLSVIRSWRSLPLPVGQGRLPAGEKFWPELAALTLGPLDVLEKQIRLCELLLQRFTSQGERCVTLRYEDILDEPSILLTAAGVAGAEAHRISVPSRRTLPSSDDADVASVKARIRHLAQQGELPGICRFYPAYRT